MSHDLDRPSDQGIMCLYAQGPKVSHHRTMTGAHRHCGSEYSDFSLACDFGRPCGWKPIQLSYHPAQFRGHKHCGGEDIFLVVKGFLVVLVVFLCVYFKGKKTTVKLFALHANA